MESSCEQVHCSRSTPAPALQRWSCEHPEVEERCSRRLPWFSVLGRFGNEISCGSNSASVGRAKRGVPPMMALLSRSFAWLVNWVQVFD
jgi:hypothetical protein